MTIIERDLNQIKRLEVDQKLSINAYIRPSKHSETLLINQLSQLRTDKQQAVFKFGFGQSPFPVPLKITQALGNAAYRKEYMSVQGHLPLRQAIVDFHKEKEQKDWCAEQIIVGSGSKILLFCVMAAFEQAEILLSAPSWVSYEPQGKLANHEVNWLSTHFDDRWRLTAQQLDEYCMSREDPNIPLIMVLNSPNNPTGQTYGGEELNNLAQVMRKHNVIVIADEIYSLLSYQKKQPSISDYYPEGCIVSSGLSKWCGAGGWRLGFIHVPKELSHSLFQAIIGVASETYSCAPSPIQVAATTAYQNHSLANDFLQKQTKLLDEISQYCCDKLRGVNVQVHDAEGGFYLFPDFNYYKQPLEKQGITTAEQFTAKLMDETGVALLPGSAFGMNNNSLTTRLAFVDFDGDQIWQDQQQPAEFERVKQGISALCQWLQAL